MAQNDRPARINDKVRVLVVDDELAIRRLLNNTLTAKGYHIDLASYGQEALEVSGRFRPDLIILDLGLPDVDGMLVLQQLRERTKVPIIILTGRGEENMKVQALDAGADDYITKPFGTGELLARMRVVMRRPSQVTEEPVFSDEDLTVDLPRRLVTVRGQEVQLTPTEYDLLRALIAYPGRVLTQHQLIQAVWGDGEADRSHLLRVTISNLRHKLEADPVRPHHILTEPGVGYRLREAP
jgi:two-component system KDP operon response regulator KdpE